MKQDGKYLYPLPDGKLVSRQRLWQLRRQAEGKCESCGKERDREGKYCTVCLGKQRAHNARRRTA